MAAAMTVYDITYRLLLLVSFVAYVVEIYVTLQSIVARFSNHPGSRLG